MKLMWNKTQSYSVDMQWAYNVWVEVYWYQCLLNISVVRPGQTTLTIRIHEAKAPNVTRAWHRDRHYTVWAVPSSCNFSDRHHSLARLGDRSHEPFLTLVEFATRQFDRFKVSEESKFFLQQTITTHTQHLCEETTHALWKTHTFCNNSPERGWVFS